MHKVEIKHQLQIPSLFSNKILIIILFSTIIGALSVFLGYSIFLFVVLAFVIAIVMMSPVLGVLLSFGVGMTYFETMSFASVVETPFKIIVLITFISWIANSYLIKGQGIPFRKLLKIPFFRMMVVLTFMVSLFFFIGTLRNSSVPLYLSSPTPMNALTSVISYVILYIITVDVLLENQLKTKQFLMGIIILSGFLMGYALINILFFGKSLQGQGSLLGVGYQHRIAQWCIVLWPFALFWIRKRGGLGALLGVFATFNFMMIVVLTKSRVSILALLIQLVVFLLFQKWSNRVKTIFVILLLSIPIFAIGFQIPDFVEGLERFARLQDFFRIDSLTQGQRHFDVAYRVWLYSSSLEVFIQDLNWLFGLGYGYFTAVLNHKYGITGDPWGYTKLVNDAHSMPIQMIVEMGIWGGILYLFFLVIGFGEIKYMIRRINFDHSMWKNLVLPSVISIVGGMVYWSVEAPNILDRPLYFIMAVISIVYWGVYKESHDNAQPSKQTT